MIQVHYQLSSHSLLQQFQKIQVIKKNHNYAENSWSLDTVAINVIVNLLMDLINLKKIMVLIPSIKLSNVELLLIKDIVVLGIVVILFIDVRILYHKNILINILSIHTENCSIISDPAQKLFNSFNDIR
jgi:hypothetical protein